MKDLHLVKLKKTRTLDRKKAEAVLADTKKSTRKLFGELDRVENALRDLRKFRAEKRKL